MSDNKENQSSADDKTTPENKKQEIKSSKDKADTRKKSIQTALPETPVRPRSSAIVAILALLIATASTAGSYILWRQLKDARLALANSDAQTRTSIGAIKPEVSTLQSKLDSLETRLDPKVQDIASKQQLLQESLQSLQVEIGREQS